ncbi:MAG: methyltransferase domain-containing protein [Saprospiraceae bacterium]|nr:methyltransferase domain-containing protein [Saprospiraceae bacterium]
MEKQNNIKDSALKFSEKHREYIRNYIRQQELEKYKGDKVFCPICQSKFRNFAPYYPWETEDDKALAEENVKCPNCSSLERHRLLWKYLNDKTNLFNSQNKSLLEFAPYEYFFDFFSNHKSITYFPCDLLPESLKFIDYKGKILKEDITKLSFEDNSFDAILCSHVLEHIVDDKLAMSELYRVMKKGGWGIFQVPIDYDREITYEDFSIVSPEGREKAFGQKDHFRWYGKDFKDRLSNAGFIVIEDLYIKKFSSEDIAKYGFDPNEIIYYCKKPF